MTTGYVVLCMLHVISFCMLGRLYGHSLGGVACDYKLSRHHIKQKTNSQHTVVFHSYTLLLYYKANVLCMCIYQCKTRATCLNKF